MNKRCLYIGQCATQRGHITDCQMVGYCIAERRGRMKIRQWIDLALSWFKTSRIKELEVEIQDHEKRLLRIEDRLEDIRTGNTY
jgi:hypothetical protein